MGLIDANPIGFWDKMFWELISVVDLKSWGKCPRWGSTLNTAEWLRVLGSLLIVLHGGAFGSIVSEPFLLVLMFFLAQELLTYFEGIFQETTPYVGVFRVLRCDHFELEPCVL